MTRRNFALTIVAFTFIVAGVGRAADEKKQPYEGTWKWTVTFNNNTREQTMKLKTEDGKPAGVVISGQNNTETKIEDASFKDGVLGFTTTRERNGMKIVSKYNGKLEGDAIKGKIETTRDGQALGEPRDWEAKREKADKPAA
jgi:hypothetical protein